MLRRIADLLRRFNFLRRPLSQSVTLMMMATDFGALPLAATSRTANRKQPYETAFALLRTNHSSGVETCANSCLLLLSISETLNRARACQHLRMLKWILVDFGGALYEFADSDIRKKICLLYPIWRVFATNIQLSQVSIGL